MSDDLSGKIRTYTSENIDVHYSLKRCIHAEECIKRSPNVFDTSKRPWINPEQGEAAQLADTIDHCPTGALHYERKDGGASEATPETNTMRVVTDGPIYVRGNVRVVNSDGMEILNDTRVALCRCGASKNKPLCDLSHLGAEFKAGDQLAANLAKSGNLMESDGAMTISVAPSKDGPLHITGNFELISSDGETTYTGSDAWLCRCGSSTNKPFCDGTHSKIGFSTTEE